MRLPLRILHEQLVLSASVRGLPRAGLALVDFVVDTGSNRSMIGYGDAVRLNVPEAALPRAEFSRIGGTTLDLRRVERITISALTSESASESLVLSDFLVAFPAKKAASERELAKSIPSLLGLDFLRKTRLALHCDPARNETYLETRG